MTTEKAEKCANASCSCMAMPNSKFCSQRCESLEMKPDIACSCGHPGCRPKSS